MIDNVAGAEYQLKPEPETAIDTSYLLDSKQMDKSALAHNFNNF